jgi:replicative DNA helicase
MVIQIKIMAKSQKKGEELLKYSKVPPQSIEIEEAVLGAILLERGAFDIANEIISKKEVFYLSSHQAIYEAMIEMQKRNNPIDVITLSQSLLKSGELESVGGAYFISKLTNVVVSSANLTTHCRILLEKYVQREIITISSNLINASYDQTIDIFDLLDLAGQDIFNISNLFLKQDFFDAATINAIALQRLDKIRHNPDQFVGVPSKFRDLDHITNGWQEPDLIILAARPSVGKTAFALNLAMNAANEKFGVGFFSLEMSSSQLMERLWSAESEVPLNHIRNGRIEDAEYNILMRDGIRKMETMPLWIDDTAALNIFQFRAKARRMVSKHNVKLIIIDYLQLMSGVNSKGGNREQEISTISRGLKTIAKELQVPIIALSQLSRAVETRKESKVPQLSDLRESGAIEQDADMVMFIYRPEYYEQNNDEMGESTHGLTEIKIAKHRNGSLGTVKLRARLDIQKFEDWDNSFQLPSSMQSFVPVNMIKAKDDTPF